MDIEKSDYGVIVSFGTWEDLLAKCRMEAKDIEDIIDWQDKEGVSLLEHSLVSRKFDIARNILSRDAKVNVVTANGYNEFHLLAANINCEGAVEIAYSLLEKGVSLNQKDLVYGNTAIFTLYLECLKQRREDVIRFLCKCFEAGADLKERNKRGLCLMELISERGPKELERYL